MVTSDLTIYKDINKFLNLSISKKFSFETTFLVILSLIKVLTPGLKTRELCLSIRLLPLQRFGLVREINRRLFLVFFRLVSNRYKSYNVFWMFNPEYYYLHNFAKWEYLVFDYRNNIDKRDSFFVEKVIKKKLVFVYRQEVMNSPADIFYSIKDNKFSYTVKIWKYIGGKNKN